VTIIAAVALLTGCGVRGGEQQRAILTARTCASTVARNGLPAPDPESITPARFEVEHRRLVDEGLRFNTVTPYRNVCNKIREEIRATAPTTSYPLASLPDGVIVASEGSSQGSDDD
jgi:hypothetical protein